MAIIYFLRLAVTGWISFNPALSEMASLSTTVLRAAFIIEITVRPYKSVADDRYSYTHSPPSKSPLQSVHAQLNLSSSPDPPHPVRTSLRTHTTLPLYLDQDKVRIPFLAYQLSPPPPPPTKNTNPNTNQWTGNLHPLLIDSDDLLVLMTMKSLTVPRTTGIVLQ